MANTSAKFKFPASTYYNRAGNFFGKLEKFTNDMDDKFFQVIRSNISSLSYKDQGILDRPTNQGFQKLVRLEQRHVDKWSKMKSENSNNPMNLVVECDEKYSRSFMNLRNNVKNSKLDVANDEYHQKVLSQILGDGNLGAEVVSMIEEVVGSDWYSRAKQMTSLAKFVDDFEEKFRAYAKKHPKNAKAIMKALEKNHYFNRLLDKLGKKEVLDQIKANPYIDKSKKANRWMSALGNLFQGKWIKAGYDYIGKYLKGPWGTVVGGAVDGYYNIVDEEVMDNFKDGEHARGSMKVVTGTIIDTVEGFGFIDGIISGAIVGGAVGAPAGGVGAVPGAIIGGAVGGIAGGANTLVKFINPEIYDNIKDGAWKGIDWISDKATVGWENTKSFVSDTWEKVQSKTEEFGDVVRSKVNNIKSNVNKTINEAKKTVRNAGKTIKKGLDTVKSSIKAIKKVKDTINPFKIPIPNFGK